MASVRAFVEGHRRVLFMSIFALFLAAAGIGISVVRGERMTDWYMHAGMWAILGAYLLITVRGLSAGRKVGPAANLALLGLFSGFWVWTLASLVPGGIALIEKSWQTRAELGILWMPIVILVLVWFLMLGMTVFLWGMKSQPPVTAVPVPAADGVTSNLVVTPAESDSPSPSEPPQK